MYDTACVARRRQDVVEVIDPAKDLEKPVLQDFTKIPGRYGLVIKDLEQERNLMENSYFIKCFR